MYYSISTNAITSIQGGYTNKEFSGSSGYEFVNQQVRRKENKKTTANTRLSAIGEKTSLQSPELFTHNELIFNPNDPADMRLASVVSCNFEKEKEKTYTLNKSKLKKKITVFFHLDNSKKFCAFYSISFPQSLTDSMAYKVFNTWLTRCRTNIDLHSYLWVAERQENGTLHFHLITNVFMPIRVVNDYMRAALITQHKKGEINTPLAILEKYNGVDVDNLYKSKRADQKRKTLNSSESQRKLQRYMTKYVTKNDVTFNRLPWHCSRDISALFTSELINEDEYNEAIELTRNSPSEFNIIEKDILTIFVPINKIELIKYTRLQRVNNQLIEKYFKKT